MEAYIHTAISFRLFVKKLYVSYLDNCVGLIYDELSLSSHLPIKRFVHRDPKESKEIKESKANKESKA